MRTRRVFVNKVGFVTALVVIGRGPRPGIAKKIRIWMQHGATFVLVSGIDLARGGSWGSWCHRGDIHFLSIYYKGASRVHETTVFEDQKSTETPSAEK